MKVYFEKRILGGFVLAIIILVGLGIYSYSNNQKSIQTSRMVSHTNEVLYYIEQLNSSVLTLEVELLRFNILGDTTFLQFYRNEIVQGTKHIQKLKELTKDNSFQQNNIESLMNLGRKKIEHIQKIIEAKRISPHTLTNLIPSPYNHSIKFQMQKVILDMKNKEKHLLETRMEANQIEIYKFNTTFLVFQIFIGAILIAVILTINGNLKKRIKAEKSLQDAKDDVQDLYDNAPCGYHSLDSRGYFLDMNTTMLKWIGYTKEEVIGKMTFLNIVTQDGVETFKKEFPTFKKQGFINNIEFNILRRDGNSFPIILNSTADVDIDGNFIRSRSSTFDNTERKLAENKIKQLNYELEAFTYSVSHDLRAPLRSIDSYAKILREDYGKGIDAEGNRLVEIIVKNARRMGQLIDDLLDFSRLGRMELMKSKVDVNQIVEAVKRELMEQEKRSNIDFAIHALEPTMADPNMLRQVWINLISNALKYSSGQQHSKIEVGCYQQKDNTIYFIRDNGVGFDMKYVSKLFGVFQRLHKIQDFEGTGVGLALVHRIIMRHGGRIWAEAKINEGATFYFFISSKHD
ncbi:MAG: ATP-binding protein [Chryseolinea sp.]